MTPILLAIESCYVAIDELAHVLENQKARNTPAEVVAVYIQQAIDELDAIPLEMPGLPNVCPADKKPTFSIQKPPQLKELSRFQSRLRKLAATVFADWERHMWEELQTPGSYKGAFTGSKLYEIVIRPDSELLRRIGVPPKDWLTVTEAAEIYCSRTDYDFDGTTGEERERKIRLARTVISTACKESRLTYMGDGKERRIDPASLGTIIVGRRDYENTRCNRR